MVAMATAAVPRGEECPECRRPIPRRARCLTCPFCGFSECL